MVKQAAYLFGTGRRKSAVAQVRITKGTGKLVFVKKADLHKPAEYVEFISEPLKLLSLDGKYDIFCVVNGGGVNSQMEAIRLAVARACAKINEESESSLKKANFLSRDPREKERKKPGLKRARRAPQWAKR